MNKILERFVDTIRYNLGSVPEKEFYVRDHVIRGNIEVLQKLIDANPDLIHWRDCWDSSLLHITAQERRPEVVRWLINAGCDVNAQDDNGETPLDVADIFPSKTVTEILLQAGATRNTEDEEDCMTLRVDQTDAERGWPFLRKLLPFGLLIPPLLLITVFVLSRFGHAFPFVTLKSTIFGTIPWGLLFLIVFGHTRGWRSVRVFLVIFIVGKFSTILYRQIVMDLPLGTIMLELAGATFLAWWMVVMYWPEHVTDEK